MRSSLIQYCRQTRDLLVLTVYFTTLQDLLSPCLDSFCLGFIRYIRGSVCTAGKGMQLYDNVINSFDLLRAVGEYLVISLHKEISSH